METILNVRTTRIRDTLFIALMGELDMYSAHNLDHLKTAIKDPSLVAVELDLTGVTYLDSVGLMQVARFYRSARSHMAPLRVYVDAGSYTHRVLGLIGAGELFEIVPAG